MNYAVEVVYCGNGRTGVPYKNVCVRKAAADEAMFWLVTWAQKSSIAQPNTSVPRLRCRRYKRSIANIHNNKNRKMKHRNTTRTTKLCISMFFFEVHFVGWYIIETLFVLQTLTSSQRLWRMTVQICEGTLCISTQIDCRSLSSRHCIYGWLSLSPFEIKN